MIKELNIEVVLGGRGLSLGETSPQGVMETKETWGDKGREGTPQKTEKWGDFFYGWSLITYGAIH